MIMDKYIRSKSSFVLGLVSGVAIVSSVGFLIFLSAYAKQNDLFSFKTTANQNEDQVVADDIDTGVANNNNQPSAAAQPDAVGKVDVKVAANDYVRGNKNAKITIVEFTDYQCPFCSRFHDTMKQVMAKYPKQVRWVLKHFPLESIHPYARKAALAAECAGEQKKFWEYTDEIFANQASLNDAYLATVAKNLKLDTNKFNSCLSSEKYASKVNADLQLGQTYGVRGTPGSFINGTTIPGAVPFEQIDAMIKPLL